MMRKRNRDAPTARFKAGLATAKSAGPGTILCRMKLFLPIALGVAGLALAIAFFMTKQDDNARHDADVGAIADFSNQLQTAQSQIVNRDGTILTLSNSLVQFQSEASVLSHQLADAQSAIVLDAEQITNLNRQVAKMQELEAGNQALGQRVTELTNQVAGLGHQLVETNQALVQAYKDYALLENRFRIDVGERVAMERKFNNPLELQAQLEKLRTTPAGEISADSIYAGLDVEVKSNGTFHVITPN